MCDVAGVLTAKGGNDVDDYLSTREAAASLGVTKNRLMGWIYNRKLVVMRRGRWYFVHIDEVERKRAELAA